MRWGKCDFRELEDLQKRMEKMLKADTQKFCEECARELAARLLSKAIRRTPVGQYKIEGKNGGTLRRGWTAKTESEAMSEGSNNAKGYANSLRVVRSGNLYAVEIINPVHYASYVEYGHRKRGGKGWVTGRFMLTISEQELQSQAQKILEKKLLEFLGGVFDGK